MTAELEPRPIGELDRRVIIEAPFAVDDGAGGASIAWTAVATVWARILVGSGRERVMRDNFAGELDLAIEIRWRDDITAAMRIVDGGRRYAIRAVMERGGRRRRLWIAATEERI